MGVRYLKRAEDGTSVTDPTQGLDLASIADLLAGGGTDPDNKTLDVVKMLASLDASRPSGMGIIGDLLGEQRQRAAQAAESYAPEAQYLQTMNPGGLFDSISGFISGLGIPGVQGPRLEAGQRLINRAPIDSLGSSFEDVMALANAAATQPAQRYDETIQSLIAPIIAKILNGSKTDTAEPAAGTSAPGGTIDNQSGVVGPNGTRQSYIPGGRGQAPASAFTPQTDTRWADMFQTPQALSARRGAEMAKEGAGNPLNVGSASNLGKDPLSQFVRMLSGGR